jgi:putative ABC transport system permease protein
MYAHAHRQAIITPPDAWAGGLVAAVIIGAAARLLPAIRAGNGAGARCPRCF